MIKQNKYAPGKLTKAQIKDIRKKYKRGKLNITKKAKNLNVSRQAIYLHLWSQNLTKKKKIRINEKVNKRTRRME